MKEFLRVLGVVSILCFGLARMEAQPMAIEGNGWTVRVRGGQGVELRVQGGALGYASTLQVAKPDWSAGLYSSSRQPPQTSAEAERILLTHSLGTSGYAKETLRKLDPNTLEWSLQIRWDSDEPAVLEWCIGLWNAILLQGASLSGQGTLATDRLQEKAITLANDLLFHGSQLTLDARLARLTIESDNAMPFTVLDGRSNPDRWWSQEIPSLWLGLLDLPLPKGETLTFRFRLRIEPKPLPNAGQAIDQSVPIVAVPDRWKPTPEPPLLIPPPKILWWGEGEPFRISDERPVRVLLESADYQPCAHALQQGLARYGIRIRVVLATEPEQNALFIGGSRALQRRYPVPAIAGAYSLRVASDSITIVGNGVEGAFYGVQTLLQWVQPTEHALQALPVRIVDYPHLRFRGVHLFPSTHPEFLPKLIRDVLAPLKFNHLVIECGYAQWEAIRPAWVKFSAPKPLLRSAVETARAHFIEPIPLIQSLGHMGWMFRNGAFRDLAEDPEMPWALASRRPEARALLERIYDEVFTLFRPRLFHIGMDEITIRGRFPYRPESAGASIAELFVEQVRWAYEKLRACGVQKVMLWSDMLLAPGEANDGAAHAADAETARWMREQLRSLPNLVLCDWHYTPAPVDGYKSVPILQEAGFQEIIATAWHNPQNIYTFAQSARQRRLAGFLQSTWVGFSLNENVLRGSEYRQFVAYAYAGLYAWDTNQPAPKDLPYDMESVFARLYHRQPLSLHPRAGFVVDLSPLGNYALSDWLGNLSETLVGQIRLSGHRFQVAPKVLRLGGYTAPDPAFPESVRLQTDRPVRVLYFLHTCAYPTEPKVEVARYRFEYEDGSVVEQPVIYGLHLRAWNDSGMAFEGVPLWSQRLEDGRWARLRLLTWRNPHPEKRLRAVQIRASDPFAGLILVALSGE